MHDGPGPAVATLPPAAAAWSEALSGWQPPDRPWHSVAAGLRRPAGEPLSSPTGQVVRDALGPDGALLDVGCADGWFCGKFAPAHDVTGVEEDHVLADQAREAGVRMVEARWVDVAPDVGVCEVVCSEHAVYDVPDLVPFLTTAHSHARRAVVVELTTRHPCELLRPLLERFDGLRPPAGPDLSLFLDVASSVVGAPISVELWRRPGTRYEDVAELLCSVRASLDLDGVPDEDLRAALDSAFTVDLDGSVLTGPVDVATVWWSTTP